MTKNNLPVIIILIISVFLLFNTPTAKLPQTKLPLYSIVSNTKDALAQDYNHIWSSATDFSPSCAPSSCTNQNKENEDWIWTDSAYVYAAKTDYGEPLLIGDGADVQSKHNFYGQEVIIYADNNNGGAYSGSISFFGSQDTIREPHIAILKPHTLNPSIVDVYENNILTRTLEVSNPFYLRFSAGKGDNFMLYFLGYKAQFSCDLASDEVWIQESFAQPFNINDLSFPAVKFCKETRPFVLRDIQQGETPIVPNPIPDFNKGNTLIPPPSNIITINYATPNVVGVTQHCGVDQANIKVAGKWVCSQVIKTTTLTREIITREIISVTDANSFTFNANKDKLRFNIGSSTFSALQKFKCSFPSDVDILRVPAPDINCYVSTIDYDGKSFELQDKQLISLSNNTSVQYFAGGELTRTENKLQGTYIFGIINPLDISLEGGLSFKQNGTGKVNIKITNNLPPNLIMLKLNQKVIRTNQNLIDKELMLKTNRGDNLFSFDADTTNLGINEIIVQAFYPITADANILLPSEKIRINVEILGEQPSIIKFIDVEKEKIVTVGKTDYTSTTPSSVKKKPAAAENTIKLILGIIVIFILFRIFN